MIVLLPFQLPFLGWKGQWVSGSGSSKGTPSCSEATSWQIQLQCQLCGQRRSHIVLLCLLHDPWRNTWRDSDSVWAVEGWQLSTPPFHYHSLSLSTPCQCHWHSLSLSTLLCLCPLRVTFHSLSMSLTLHVTVHSLSLSLLVTVHSLSMSLTLLVTVDSSMSLSTPCHCSLLVNVTDTLCHCRLLVTVHSLSMSLTLLLVTVIPPNHVLFIFFIAVHLWPLIHNNCMTDLRMAGALFYWLHATAIITYFTLLWTCTMGTSFTRSQWVYWNIGLHQVLWLYVISLLPASLAREWKWKSPSPLSLSLSLSLS